MSDLLSLGVNGGLPDAACQQDPGESGIASATFTTEGPAGIAADPEVGTWPLAMACSTLSLTGVDAHGMNLNVTSTDRPARTNRASFCAISTPTKISQALMRP
jgi:hypothetical protein